MAKQIAAQTGVSQEEIQQEEQVESQEEAAINNEKEQVTNTNQLSGSEISPMIANESIENINYDSILFESILYEGLFDKIKIGVQNLGNSIKTGATNAYNNAKEYFANNTRNALNRTSMETIRATFDELATKVATFTSAVKEVQPIFNATGNSKFEIFNRKLGKVLLTAGGIVRLAGIACPPLAAVGTAMAGLGAVANGIGNTRKDAVTGHKVKAGIDVLGGIGGAAMGASAVGRILGQSENILAKVSGIGKTLTGAKITANGISTTKNSSSKLGKGMGILSALGGVAMTLSGLSALGVQFSGNQLSAEDAAHLKQGDTELQKGAQSIVNDEQVKELTAERAYLEENPGAETEHSELLADTILKQVENNNESIAHANVGDWIIRSDGTKIQLKQFDIDYAKAAIGEIKPETNPFDPENPMVGQITQKGHMITDKDMAILRPNNSPEVVTNQVPQVESELPEAPAAPISDAALDTQLDSTEGVDELANSPEAIETQLEDTAEETVQAEQTVPEVQQTVNELEQNIAWSETADQPVTGAFRFESLNAYGKTFQAVKFNTDVTVCPIYNSKTGAIAFIHHFKGKDYFKIGSVTGVSEEHLNLVKITALRNAGFTVNFANNQVYITDKSGQLYSPGYQLLGYSLPNQA
jgi:hypothetical protein